MENLNGINRKSYSDRVDMDFNTSLFEYGLVRNPKTNKVIFCINYFDVEEYGFEWEDGEPVPIYHTTHITWSDVWDALEKAEDEYYKFIGSDRNTEMNNLDKDYLTHHIQSLNMYNGWFDPWDHYHGPTY